MTHRLTFHPTRRLTHRSSLPRAPLAPRARRVPLAPLARLVALAALAACGSTEPTHPSFAPIEAAVTADLAKANATGASIAVWLDGEIRWVGGFGHADPNGTAPPDEDTQFMIGSDTKKLTAIALLQQVAKGKTTLDATVGAVLPDLHLAMAPGFTDTTLRQLMSHQSGIMDGIEETSDTTDAGLASFAYGEFASTYHRMNPPGLFYNYSNPNFSIAGLVTQQLDGRPWADLVEADVFAPLGMTRTVARKREVDDDRALGRGYSADQPDAIHAVSFADTWESAFTRPAGLVWSTPDDQMRVARFLVDGDPAVLDPALRGEITRAQTPVYPGLPPGYGFGLLVGRGIQLGNDYYDVPVWTHGGNTRTHTSTFLILPEQRFAISILSNGVDDDFSGTVIAAIKALVPLPAPSPAPERPFDPTQLDGLVGTYTDPFQVGDVVVAHVGDGLTITVPALDAAGIAYDHALARVTTRVWFATVDGAPVELTFIDGPDGATYLRNRDFVAIRPPRGATVAPIAAPDPARIRAMLRSALR